MMAPTPAAGEDRSVALALVNTLHSGPADEIDHLRTPEQISEWITDRSLASTAMPVRPRDVTRFAQLRAVIRELFIAMVDGRVPDSSTVSQLNRASRAVPGAPSLQWSSGTPNRLWISAASRPCEAALAVIAADAIDVLCGPQGQSLRRCEAHGCVRVFIRQHARRRWCCTTCGDRVRAARHYRLQQRRDGS